MSNPAARRSCKTWAPVELSQSEAGAVVVRLCRSYGAEAHRAWADQGFGPTVRGVHVLGGATDGRRGAGGAARSSSWTPRCRARRAWPPPSYHPPETQKQVMQIRSFALPQSPARQPRQHIQTAHLVKASVRLPSSSRTAGPTPPISSSSLSLPGKHPRRLQRRRRGVNKLPIRAKRWGDSS